MASSEYRKANLLKLGTSKVPCRRDSLSSSRTQDSGYNSELEVSLSPRDFVVPEHEILFASLPPVPSLSMISESCLWKKHPNFIPPLSHQAGITSNPSPCGTVEDHGLHWTGAVSVRRAKGVSDALAHIVPANDLSSDIEKWIKDNLPSRHQPQERVSSITSLSSTSSCEMYTNTDSSDDEREPEYETMQPSRPKSTLKVIELIMRKIEINIREAAYRQCTSTTPSSRGGVVSHQGSRKSSQSSGQKRKARGSPPPDDNDDENGPNKRRRGSAATVADNSDPGTRFACPFYKHDPDRYRNIRTCPGPGWPTVHRMKEHLYRAHSQPIFCPICYETFKSDKEQFNHVRLQQCQRSAPQHIEGMDRETTWALRKRTTALRLEEDKWRDVYHVLFPNVLVADIPSPFYDCDSPSESSRRFRRELLRRVQEELLITAGQVPGPIEQQLLQRVAQIIRRCENDLLNLPEPSIENAMLPDRLANSTSTTTPSVSTDPHSHTHFTAMSAPTSRSIPRAAPFNSATLEANRSNTATMQVRARYITEPAVNITPVVWDEQIYDTFDDGIDWDMVFMREPEIQHSGGNGPLTALATPMWT
ncbi:uncharacterized protein K460DRAFT_309456 [Cucurbitaria berberidis CBS 394.84]|uniref:C2H2-type domain-containing protein n=1 Tax=Cucurbitaria berberidis CBS 394.84 TaxID=1168544 RepID=A0A9P4GFY0_9PLEO|nr:uncharacterized protein K460DRAFT_309456 [Cucurbitaria berberidis CBS 394.84]KAF1844509.1 hypothetical protein K460DRAFT_309456 [Cucurbitaria berberidis CBS 394.84]